MENNDAVWLSMLQEINAGNDPTEDLNGHLKKISEYFGFGSGFVYQSDHTGMLYLMEHFSNYGTEHIPATMDLEKILGKEKYKNVLGSAVVVTSLDDGEGNKGISDKLASLFSASSIILMPMTNDSTMISAVIGFTDRREWLNMSKGDIHRAVALMGAVAGRVKLRQYHAVAENSRNALGSVLDNLGIDVYVNDFYTHEILYANRSMAAPYGGIEKMMGKKCYLCLYDDKTEPCEFCPENKIIDENGEPTKIYSWDYQRPFDKSWFRVLSAAFKWVDGRTAHCVTSVDITENKRNEATILRLAEIDTLTGMPNRNRMLARCTPMFEETISAGNGGYVLFFDLDHFKTINDTYGHRSGDALLSRIGAFLRTNEKLKDYSYRISGDEFVIWCFDKSPEAIKEIIKELKDRFKKPWDLDKDGHLECKCSVGVSVFPDDTDDMDDAIHMADMAMYSAKRSDGDDAYFYNNGSPIIMDKYFKK